MRGSKCSESGVKKKMIPAQAVLLTNVSPWEASTVPTYMTEAITGPICISRVWSAAMNRISSSVLNNESIWFSHINRNLERSPRGSVSLPLPPSSNMARWWQKRHQWSFHAKVTRRRKDNSNGSPQRRFCPVILGDFPLQVIGLNRPPPLQRGLRLASPSKWKLKSMTGFLKGYLEKGDFPWHLDIFTACINLAVWAGTKKAYIAENRCVFPLHQEPVGNPFRVLVCFCFCFFPYISFCATQL